MLSEASGNRCPGKSRSFSTTLTTISSRTTCRDPGARGCAGVRRPSRKRIVCRSPVLTSRSPTPAVHELAHVFTFQIVYTGSSTACFLQNYPFKHCRCGSPRLAEYLSAGWDTESDMFMRDASSRLPR